MEGDHDLVALIVDGSAAAFSVLVERHATRHVAFAERVTGSRSDAEDVVQDCFIKLWNAPEKFNPEKARFGTWFYRVVMNRCLDGKRKKSPLPLPDNFDQVDDGPGPDCGMEGLQLAARMKDALDALPERQKAALVLTYYEELSNQDAASVMDMNIKALESLLLRARRSLSKHLADSKHDLLEAID